MSFLNVFLALEAILMTSVTLKKRSEFVDFRRLSGGPKAESARPADGNWNAPWALLQ